MKTPKAISITVKLPLDLTQQAPADMVLCHQLASAARAVAEGSAPTASCRSVAAAALDALANAVHAKFAVGKPVQTAAMLADVKSASEAKSDKEAIAFGLEMSLLPATAYDAVRVALHRIRATRATARDVQKRNAKRTRKASEER